MCLRTHGYLKTKAAIVSSVAGAAAVMAEIDALVLSITDQAKQYEKTSAGTTANKNLLRQALVEATEQNIAILVAFAAKDKNITLSKEMKKLVKKIAGSGALKLVNRAGLVLDTLAENLAALTDWQVTAASQTAFKDQIAEFQVMLGKPKEKINERKGLHQQIENSLKLLATKWVEMDDMMGASAKQHPEFIVDYRQNRQVVNPSTSKLAAMLTVQDSADYSPIEKVSIVTPFGTFKTSRTGKTRIKTAPDGSYLVSVMRTGFQSATFTINIVSGITTKETLRLQAA